MFICVTVSLFQWFSPRWAPRGARLLGFDCPTIHDSSLDRCFEVAVVTLADYSLETPHWIIHLGWRWIPPVEYFELETFDLFWHFVRFMIQSDGLWGNIYSRFDRSDSSIEHLLRLMESLSNLSCGLRVVAARYTRAYLPLIISLHFQLDIQSHHVSFLFDI